MRIAIAQIDACTGAFRYNLHIALDMAMEAADEGADLIVFPEYALCGAVNEGLLWSTPFLQAARRSVTEFASKCPLPAVIGSLCPGAEEGDQARSAAYFCNDEGEAVLLDPDDEELPIVEVGGKRIAICLGFELEYDAPSQTTDVVVELASDPYAGPGSCPTEPGELGGAIERATSGQVWVVHCNLVGGQDERIFPGGSYCLSPAGEVVAGGQLFKQHFLVTDELVEDAGHDPALVEPAPEDADRVLWDALKLALADYVTKNRFSDVVVGLSGGIDSALAATLAVDALGAEHVHGVMMPGPFSSSGSVEDARELGSNLGIPLQEIPIDTPFAAFKDALADACGGAVEGIALENIQARIRMCYLMALSNTHGWMVLNTGNKSESAVGFSTLYGDTAGAFAPFGDVYKTQMYALAEWRNGDGVLIPQAIIDKAPSAELYEGALDQDRLPPYELLDAIVSRHVEGDRGLGDLMLEGYDGDMVEKVLGQVSGAEFKRRQEPVAPGVSGVSFADRGWPITNRFEERRPRSPMEILREQQQQQQQR